MMVKVGLHKFSTKLCYNICKAKDRSSKNPEIITNSPE